MGINTTKTVFVKLSEADKQEVKKMASFEGVSMSELFKRALTYYSGYLEGRRSKKK